jgi:enoyl-[acyl-carrier protein] reductase/trans-2-enoyl-CoA reductase (NAD+)
MAKQVIGPKVRGFICTTAHPAGCAANVAEQVLRIRGRKPIVGPKNVLVIGASTGYGLASRITAAFGAGAHTLGIFYERPAQGERTASAGWYNSIALESLIRQRGLKAWSINGDAFSDAMRESAIALLRREFGPVDLVIYSLAAPQRLHPHSGQVFRSVLKPIGGQFSAKTVFADRGTVCDVTLEPATDEEIASTVAVMGGEDWQFWMEALASAGVLAPGVKTVAYSYIGPQLTWPIYRDGTIGRAKMDLDGTAKRLNDLLLPLNGRAHISVNKAVVTQASSAIPVVPLYISLLFQVMKERKLHEDCLDQIWRLFSDVLYADPIPPGAIDGAGRLRIDGREMDASIQAEVMRRWPLVTTENLPELGDIAGYEADFLRLFGFGLLGIDYNAAVETDLHLEACNG